MSRRHFLAAVTAAALTSDRAWPQTGALPLDNLGLEHLDVIVPDAAASARFYMQLFDTALHEQSFRNTVRYFVLLGDLPADRQVGYVAIGTAGDRPVQIGHYCALVRSYDRDALASALAASGYPVPAGGFGLIPDVDGIELQLFTPPAGLVTAAVPSPLNVKTVGLVRPHGLDYVLLQVADIERSLAYYRSLYGTGIESSDALDPDRIWFRLEADTRVGIEPAPPGVAPRIARFGIKVGPFDQDAVVARLREIGAGILATSTDPGVVRFRDPDGITLELITD